jgi:dihydropteroate synthase
MPLADSATHEQRRKLAPLLRQVQKAMTPSKAIIEVMRRMGVKDVRIMAIATMNEATARKAVTATENLIMDIMSGQVDLKK